MMVKLRCEEWAIRPTRAHKRDAGIDLHTPEEITVPTGGSAVIDTGIHADIPFGTFGKIESKSGLNINHDIVSCGGVIDAGFTGTIKVKLYNLGKADYKFHKGDKVVQIVFLPCDMLAQGIEVETAEKREENGYGSSGR